MVSKAVVTILVLSLFSVCLGSGDIGYEFVTTGSSLKLQHVSSGFRLHSHDIKWGSGSGQQSVTAHPSDSDSNSLWQVVSPFGSSLVSSGSPIACGSQVRLRHVRTRLFLHSHWHKAPLSGEQEVSGFPGESDSGDNWLVECEEEQGFWRRGEDVKFKHVDTGKWLATSTRSDFNQNNCRNCPIQGQLEVRAQSAGNHDADWRTAEGYFFPVSEEFMPVIGAQQG